MSITTLYIDDWTNLDEELITNLYLYGETSTPEEYYDRLRTAQEYTALPTGLDSEKQLNITLEMDTYMSTGGGRYAKAALAKVVDDFFDGTLVLANGSYTKAQILANTSYINEDFRFSFAQSEIDPGSIDYGLRTYIYNAQGFEISDDVVFVVDNGTLSIQNMAVHALQTDFDFETGGFWAGLGNDYVLKPEIDPYSIGRQVEIIFANKENVPTTTYTLSDYNNDVTYLSNLDIGSSYVLSHGYPAMLDVINTLKSSGVIDYDTNDNGLVIYGSADNDNTSSAIYGSVYGDIVVAGDGDDTVTAQGGRDIIYGGAGSDTLYGNGGDDHFVETVEQNIIDGGDDADLDVVDYSMTSNGYGIKAEVQGDGSIKVWKWDASTNSTIGNYDTLTSIDVVIGTQYSDYFVFGADPSGIGFSGGAGDDYYDISQVTSFFNAGRHIQEESGSDNNYLIAPGYNPDSTTGTPDSRDGMLISPDNSATNPAPNGSIYLPENVDIDGLKDNFSATPDTIPSFSDQPEEDIDIPDNSAPAEAQDPFGEAKTSQVSPLVLDLYNPGIDLTSLDSKDAVYWDIDVDGYKEYTGWVFPTDGLLAIDLNSDGLINDNSELFGDQTGSANGFEALAYYDTNSDGLINSSDNQFSDLLVWIDNNIDGYSSSGELFTLSFLGITEIDLNYTNVNYDIEGNTIKQQSSFTMNGEQKDILDVWFTYTNANTEYSATYDLDVRTFSLPTLRGYGNLPDLHVAMSQNENLLDMVKGLSAEGMGAFLGNSEEFFYQVRDVLQEWAGVRDLPGDTRGRWNNAGDIIFLERLLGEEFIWEPVDSPVVDGGGVLAGGAQLLAEAIDRAVFAYAHRILLQTAGDEIFTVEPNYNVLTDTFLGNSVSLNISGIQSLVSNNSANEGEIVHNWLKIFKFFESTIGLNAISSSDQSSLDTIIQNSSSNYTISYSLFENAINRTGVGGYGTTGNDVLFGVTVKNDEAFNGHEGDDIIFGFEDNDHILGGDGNDFIFGGNGSESMWGDDGNDFLFGGQGSDQLYGGYGNDTLDGGWGWDLLAGEWGDDDYIIRFEEGLGNTLENYFGLLGQYDGVYEIANEGYDVVHITGVDYNSIKTWTDTGGVYYIDYGNGVVRLEAQTNTYNGASDVAERVEEVIFNGTITWDLSQGLYINTPDEGNYDLRGTNSNDTIISQSGNDNLYGYDGSDYLHAGDGYDVVSGGLGNDTYVFAKGDGSSDINLIDTIYEGIDEGDDTVVFLDSSIDEVINWYDGGSFYFQYSDVTTDLFRFSATLDSSGLNFNDSFENFEFIDNQSWDVATGLVLNDRDVGSPVYGSSQSDTIYGNGGADYIYGYAGHDLIKGGTGNDVLHGDGGNDIFVFEAGDEQDTIADFTRGEDKIDLTAYTSILNLADLAITDDGTHSTIDLGNGDEVVIQNHLTASWLDTDFLFFGIRGTSESNLLIGTSENDTIYGLDGDDTIEGGAGDDQLYGGDGRDKFIYNDGFGDDIIYDFSYAEDRIDVSQLTGIVDFSDVTITQSGIDVEISFAGHTGTITKTVSAHTSWSAANFIFTPIHGTSGDDYIYGTGGDDTIYGHGGSDIIYGYEGYDYIEGNDQLDWVYGGDDDDHVIGNDGDDRVYGEWGNDTLEGNNGIDYLWGGWGNDTLYGGADGDALRGEQNSDTIYGGDGNDNIRGDDADSTPGWQAAGDDFLYGEAGNDNINGGDGDDFLSGGTGLDTLTGGAGIDTFHYEYADLDGSRDYIMDFTAGTGGDILDLSNVIDYDPVSDTLSDFVTIVTGGSYTRINIDYDGTGTTHSLKAVAQLQGVTGLTLTDLVNDGNLIVA